MQFFESGGALVTRPAVVFWRKFAAAMAVSLTAVTVSPALAVYLLLIN